MKNEKKSLRQMVDENPIFSFIEQHKCGFEDCYLTNATPHSSFFSVLFNSAQKVCRTTFNFIICSFLCFSSFTDATSTTPYTYYSPCHLFSFIDCVNNIMKCVFCLIFLLLMSFSSPLRKFFNIFSNLFFLESMC